MSQPSLSPQRAQQQARGASSNGLYYPYRTPYGTLTIRVEQGSVTNIALGDVSFEGKKRPTELASTTATQIQEYLAGKRQSFSVPYAPQGTPFQQSVWRAVSQIPYGQTRTCADIASSIQRPDSFRAVGSAVRHNPLVMVIPAHRVVDTAGKPLGSGREARVKGALLRLEQKTLRGAEG